MADEYISIYDIGETQDDKDVQYKNQNEEIPISLPSNFKPEIVSKNNSQSESKKDNSASPFKPTWVYGFNKNVPILNFFSEKMSKIIFSSGIYLVIYDTRQKQQKVLENHQGNISCLSQSLCGNLCVSGSKGELSHSIFVWNILGECMVQQIRNPHGLHGLQEGLQGVDQIKFTSNSQYVISIGGVFLHQSVCIWDWKNEPDCPVSCVSLPSGKVYTCLNTHPLQQSRFLVSSKTTCIFFTFDETRGELLQHNPGSVEKEFGKSSGHLVHTLFIRDRNEVLGGTNRGNLVTWVASKPNSANTDQAMKIGRLLRLDEEGISALAESETLILVGGCKGKLTIISHDLQKLQWVQSFTVPKILSFSFRIKDEQFERQGDGVNLVDFILTCEGGDCYYFHSNNTSISPLIEGPGGPWNVLDIHPENNCFIVAKSTGVLATFNYLTNERIGLTQLKIPEEITTLKFSNDGNLISIGTKKGNIWLLNFQTFDPITAKPFSHCKGSIKHLLFSSTDEYLASSDLDRCVTIYQNVDGEYKLLGRHRCHTKQISEIKFGLNSENGNCNLYTIGKDMKLNEFDLKESSFQEGLKLKARVSIEQSYLPTCMSILPESSADEQFLVIANDAHKIRFINMTTKLCRRVLLSPQLEDHINKIVDISTHINGRTPDSIQNFVLQCGKFLGLANIPLQGYSTSYKTQLVSSEPLDEFVVSHDGKYCFTLTKSEEHAVTQHSIDANVMEENMSECQDNFKLLVSSNLRLYNDMKDYFSLVQIMDGSKCLLKTIPTESIVLVCRALGFYPTEKEQDDMVNEIKYSSFVTTGTMNTDVHVDTLFKVFMNHRLYQGKDFHMLEHAFNTMKKNQGLGNKTHISSHKFFQFLKNEGETFNQRDFTKYLAPLFIGQSKNDEETFNVPDEIDFNSIKNLLNDKI